MDYLDDPLSPTSGGGQYCTPIRGHVPTPIDTVIGHLKAEHRMDRNYLKGYEGDRINAVLAAAGYNFALLLRWLAALLRALIRALAHDARQPQYA